MQESRIGFCRCFIFLHISKASRTKNYRPLNHLVCCLIAGVHDSYWTHACDVDVMNRILREKFVELYETQVLENVKHLDSMQSTTIQHSFYYLGLTNSYLNSCWRALNSPSLHWLSLHCLSGVTLISEKCWIPSISSTKSSNSGCRSSIHDERAFVVRL